MKKNVATAQYQLLFSILCFVACGHVYLPTNAYAADWSSPAHDFFSSSQTLARGKSAFSFATQGRELTDRLSSSGRKEQMFAPVRSGDQKLDPSASTPSDEVTGEKVRLDQFRVVPAWAHGITSHWTIGALLPLINTNVTSTSSENGDTQKRANTRIGNVEVLSKELLFVDRKKSFALSQRLRFPSAQGDEDEEAVVPVPDPNGYGLGAGGIYDYYLMRAWSVGLSAEYCLNMPDKALDFSTAEPTDRLARDPGDVTTLGMHTALNLGDDFQFLASATHMYKNRDRYEETNAINESTSFSEQLGGELGLMYTPESEDTSDELYSLQFKYFATLAGRNIQDEDTLSLQMQFYY